MSSFQLQFDLSDLDRIASGIVNIDPAPVYNAIGETLRSMTEMSFRDQKSPRGEHWESSRRVQAEGGKTLIDSGDLKNSPQPQVVGDELEFGPSNVIYAAIHQFGGQAGRGRKVSIPRRQYVPEPEDLAGDQDFLDEVGRIVRKELVRQIGKA